MKLDEFLTQGLIESLQNGLIAPELIVVYAGNYLAKSLITADEMTQVQNAVASYQAAQASNASGSASVSASEPASASEVASASASEPASEPASDVASASASATASASESTSETAASNTNQPA